LSTTTPPINDAVTADIVNAPFGTTTNPRVARTRNKTRTRNALTGLPMLPQRATGKKPLMPAGSLLDQGRVCGRM
jgi:hypothetical protein